MPLVRPLAHGRKGRARTQGIAHSEIGSERRGTASPLTSGGEAAADDSNKLSDKVGLKHIVSEEERN